MGDTSVKINLKEGTFELDGSETFVEKHWNEMKSYLENLLVTESFSDSSTGSKPRKPKPHSGSHAGVTPKKGISYTPIPINLKGGANTISLKDFFKQKSPKSNQEIITLFAYYLDKYCGIPDMEFGHAMSCYNEVGVKKPTNLLSLCNNVRNRGGWLEAGSQPYTFKINISGQNLIDHDLPRKEISATKNK